jgi:hypothetical protein
MRHVWIPSLAFTLFACGGTVVYDEDTSSSGDGGASAQSGSTTSRGSAGTGGAPTSTTTGSPTTSVGTSSAQGGGSSVSSTNTGPSSSGVTVGPGSGGGSSCGDLNYAECLGALDRCVPEFDDLCCSSCFPGECADCVDFRAVGCVDRLEGSQCGAVSCGFVPDWACNFDKPDCEDGCFGVPGCVEKQECFGDGCSIGCGAIEPDACGDPKCNAIPPECFDGQVPEVSGSCWTGLCIPSWVCQFSF